MHLRFDVYGQSIAGDDRYAQTVMRDLGIIYSHATPQSMGDQWWFWNCNNVPSPLPPHFSVLEINPHECIGYGLSKEEADEIAAAAASK